MNRQRRGILCAFSAIGVLNSIIFVSNNASAEEIAPSNPPAAASNETKAAEPFAFADFTWLNGNSRQQASLLDSKYFTGEFFVDSNYIYDFNHPKDHTIDGSSEVGRAGEVQVQQLGVGGDFHYQNVRGRLMTQLGMYSTETPRNDGSTARGQWQTDNAYRYLSEAYGGYHFDIWNGINVDAGIFMSYIGLFSYYNYENWAYQPSFVSSNTPWYFNGIRVQTFPSDKLKIEYWIVNGWQSYGMYNEAPGLGIEFMWRPNGSVSIVSNNYYGHDTQDHPNRIRYHSDNSLQLKYLDNPTALVSKAALSLTVDAGCEQGGGVRCIGSSVDKPNQSFTGFMLYNRLWFDKDVHGLTIGGGAINNPGRYLVLLPPIQGATAATGSADFPLSPGSSYRAWDATITYDYMPNPYITFRVEFDHRVANVPYFVGPGGVTSPDGYNNVTVPADWKPDLVKSENRINTAMMVRF
ncbi:MAG: porin [Chitinophagaceae bacterium]|nr:porin [Oligoflexus sp.]